MNSRSGSAPNAHPAWLYNDEGVLERLTSRSRKLAQNEMLAGIRGHRIWNFHHDDACVWRRVDPHIREVLVPSNDGCALRLCVGEHGGIFRATQANVLDVLSGIAPSGQLGCKAARQVLIHEETPHK